MREDVSSVPHSVLDGSEALAEIRRPVLFQKLQHHDACLGCDPFDSGSLLVRCCNDAGNVCSMRIRSRCECPVVAGPIPAMDVINVGLRDTDEK